MPDATTILREFEVRIEWRTKHSKTYGIIARNADDAKEIAAMQFYKEQPIAFDKVEIEAGA